MLLKVLVILSFFTFSVNVSSNFIFEELVGFSKSKASGTYAPPPPFPDEEDEEEEDEE